MALDYFPGNQSAMESVLDHKMHVVEGGGRGGGGVGEGT